MTTPAGRDSSEPFAGIASPRVEPRARSFSPAISAIDDPDQLAVLLRSLMRNPTPARDIVRAADAAVRLRGTRPRSAGALVTAARARLTTGDDHYDLDPRRYLARIVLAWLDEPIDRRGYRGHVTTEALADGEEAPTGHDRADIPWQSFHAGEVSGWVPVDTGVSRRYEVVTESWSPASLFALWLDEVADRVAGRTTASPVADALAVAETRGPAFPARWSRVHGHAPAGRFWTSPYGPMLGWVDSAATPASLDSITDAPFDLFRVFAEYSFRVEQAFFSPHATAIMEWYSDLLDSSPDHLAAHAHPLLWASTSLTSVNAGPVVIAIGAARSPLGPPAYSALALALGDKNSGRRPVAVAAVAELARSGFLDPPMFAEQLELVVSDGFVPASRIAGALAEVAASGAIAGWRVFETVLALLPPAASAAGGVRFVELAERLARDYGAGVVVPPELLARARGSSALAKAIRALGDAVDQPTSLARQAADEAALALRN